MTKEQFKKFAKEEFGYDISFEKSDEPDTYESLFGSCKGCEHAPTTYIDAIMDGVELPKGHGRLIDASELAKSVCTWLKPTVPDETMLVDIAEVGVGVIDEIEEQPTVIEADKED